MTLQQLRLLRESGRFHHATYRNQGTLWEGLWIYETSDMGRGFAPAGCFHKDSPELVAAEAELRSTGISLGAYGEG